MEQQKKHPNEVVRALMNNAKTIFKDTFGGYPENHPDAVAAIAQLLQNEGMLNIHQSSFELQKKGVELAIQNTESSLKANESAIEMNATTTALAEAQIQWLNEQRAMYEMERVDSEPLTTVGQPKVFYGRQISFYGIQFEVPKWAKYVAVDKNNDLWAFEEKPEAGMKLWVANDGRRTTVANMGSQFDADWRKTLQEVVKIQPSKESESGSCLFTYKGVRISIPTWANFITTSASGVISAHEFKPSFDHAAADWTAETGRRLPINNIFNVPSTRAECKSMALNSLVEVK